MPTVRLVQVGVACAVAVTVAACGSPAASSSSGRLSVAASFYPLQWIAEQVGGDLVDVSTLTKPGAEPHDLELTPRDVAAVGDSDLVVYLSGFQPAVDDAVAAEAPDSAFDAADAAHLDLTYTPIEGGTEVAAQAGATDPHFWLAPLKLADVVDALAERLGRVDPGHAADFTARAAMLRGSLVALDAEFRAGLSTCTNTDLVTSHNAFGYLAQAYGLDQVGITGLTPEQEPSAADLARVTTFVKDHDVQTIYYETLISPDIADTVASEAGVATAVLDPIEGLTDASAGSDYLAVMRSNLASIRAGQPCP